MSIYGPNFPDKTNEFCSMRLERALILLAPQSIFFCNVAVISKTQFCTECTHTRSLQRFSFLFSSWCQIHAGCPIVCVDTYLERFLFNCKSKVMPEWCSPLKTTINIDNQTIRICTASEILKWQSVFLYNLSGLNDFIGQKCL